MNLFARYVHDSDQCGSHSLTSHTQISRASAAVSSTIEKTTEPIRNTAAYKTLSETISDALDDSGSAKHAGFEEKEARRKRRQLRLEKAGRNSIGIRTKANPEYVIPAGLVPVLVPYCLQCWSGHGLAQGLSSAREVEPDEGDKPTSPSIR